MSFETLGPRDSFTNSASATASEPLSQAGQLIGWGIYGTLLVIGFAFGIVTGYERPKTITVAKSAGENDQSKPEPPKSETPKNESSRSAPKPNPSPEPPNASAVKETPNSSPVPNNVPKVDPKPVAPMPAMPPKVDPKPAVPTTPTPPKTDPKPPAPTTTTPAKTDAPPKKDDLKPVSFKTDVLPVLRANQCLSCHGATGKAKGNVDLTTLAKAMKSSSKMVVPGKPNESDIFTSITEREMPQNNPKPSEKDLLILKNWILTGAKE